MVAAVKRAMVQKYYLQILSQNKEELDEHQEQRRLLREQLEQAVIDFDDIKVSQLRDQLREFRKIDQILERNKRIIAMEKLLEESKNKQCKSLQEIHKVLKQKTKGDKSYIVYDHKSDQYEVLDPLNKLTALPPLEQPRPLENPGDDFVNEAQKACESKKISRQENAKAFL